MPRNGLVPNDVPGSRRPDADRRDRRRVIPRYLTATGSGWRFQMRLPIQTISEAADSELEPIRFTIRASLDERPRLDAERTAQRLATLCRAVCGLAGGTRMGPTALTAHETDVVASVVAACQEAIARALAEPSEAIGLAKGLQGALDTLKLVEGEVGKGAGGIASIVKNAETLTRGALEDTLRLSADPTAGLAALAMMSAVSPPACPAAETAPRANAQQLPTFGVISQSYIDMRRNNASGTKEHPDINYLVLRRQTFLDIVGDKPVNDYFPSDLQNYVDEMQHWPSNVTKRSSKRHLTTRQILADNRDGSNLNLARKTMKDGYLANIRTMMRYGMADFKYRDPFDGVDIRWPAAYRAPTEREDIDRLVLGKAFVQGIASGQLDEAILPLLAALTSRRLALLIHLRGCDIREKHGVWIAQVKGRICVDDKWMAVPLKTDESNRFFVLHRFLDEIGFIAWAREQPGFLFEAAHEHPNAAKYVSKVLNRLLVRAGAAGDNTEVFHSLRGDSIQMMRDDELAPRTARLQAGHELRDVHDHYGRKSLQAPECQRLFDLPLPADIDWKIFKGLDFDKMAAKRRTRGRAKRCVEQPAS